MKKELLSITDENSILITAEFLESGERLKVRDGEQKRLEMDLVVRKSTTCDQLLEAIGTGLQYRLLTQYNIDVLGDDFTEFVYRDSRDEDRTEGVEPELSDFEKAERKGLFSPLGRFIELNKERLRLLREEKIDQQREPEEIKEKEPEKKEPSENETGKKRDGNEYVICWAVFKDCYDEYMKKSPEGSEEETNLRHPVIGTSAINYRVLPDGWKLSKSDRYQILLSQEKCGDKTIEELGFVTSTRIIFDRVGLHTGGALLDEEDLNPAFKDTVPLYNISEQPFYKLDDEPVHIISPDDPPQKDRNSMLTQILSPLLMTGSMVGVRLLMGGAGYNNASLLLMTGSMSAVTILMAFVNRGERKRVYKEDLRDWRNHYEGYIRRTLGNIIKKQAEDVGKMEILYPSARDENDENNLVNKILRLDGSIYGRGKNHPDFLKVRIGRSTESSQLIPSVFAIDGEKQEAIYAEMTYHNIRNLPSYPFQIFLSKDEESGREDGSTGFLNELPYDISQEYAYLKNAPVLLDLKKSGTIGIVFEDPNKDFTPFLSNMILDLCYNQSPDDLQCILFCEKSMSWQDRQDVISRYKHLPHFRELLGDISAFAFEKDDAYLIFNKLLEILTNRRQNKEDKNYPHIVVFVQEEYEIKKHLVSEFFPRYGESEEDDLGISFVFCKRHLEELPRYCGQVIRTTAPEKRGEKEKWALLPHEQTITRGARNNEERYGFVPDQSAPEREDMGEETYNASYYRAFKALSSLYYLRIAQGTDVPSSVDLFEIFGNINEAEPEKLAEALQKLIMGIWKSGYWQEASGLKEVRKKDITESLAVPLGKSASGIIELDLHEKGDGPHMLVAGTTGSGKTETILTCLVNLCAIYTPEEVNLLLMDMKGAGFVQRIGDEKEHTKLPHVVGTVTDISGDEAGTGMLYMLKRFLQSMTAEVKRRKRKLNEMGVDSVDEYTKAKRNPEKFVKTHKRITPEEIRRMPYLPHLFVVIDEFTELMRFSSDNDDVDFRAEITSLARIGRSLGFHIILISQNIENAITPDIRVNSRARLCLKVATRDASRDMIGTDLAASPLMPGNGRAYLLVGTGSRFEYFQSAYSGADISRNMDNPVVVTHAEFSGEYSLLFNSEKTGKELERERAERGILPDEQMPSETDREPQTEVKASGEGLAPEVNVSTQKVETEAYDESRTVSDDLKQTEEDTLNEGTSDTEIHEEETSAVNVSEEDVLGDTSEEDVAEEEIIPEEGLSEEDIPEVSASEEGALEDALEKERSEKTDSEKQKPENADTKKSRTGITQLKILVEQIIVCNELFKQERKGEYEVPHCVFQDPLPERCCFDFDWETKQGYFTKLTTENDKERRANGTA